MHLIILEKDAFVLRRLLVIRQFRVFDEECVLLKDHCISPVALLCL